MAGNNEEKTAYIKRRVSHITDIVGFQTIAYKKTISVYPLPGGYMAYSLLFCCHTVETDNNGYFTYTDLVRYSERNMENVVIDVLKFVESGFIADHGRPNRFWSKRFTLTHKAHLLIKYHNRLVIKLLDERKADIFGKGESIRYSDIKAKKKALKKQKKEKGP